MLIKIVNPVLEYTLLFYRIDKKINKSNINNVFKCKSKINYQKMY